MLSLFVLCYFSAPVSVLHWMFDCSAVSNVYSPVESQLPSPFTLDTRRWCRFSPLHLVSIIKVINFVDWLANLKADIVEGKSSVKPVG